MAAKRNKGKRLPSPGSAPTKDKHLNTKYTDPQSILGHYVRWSAEILDHTCTGAWDWNLEASEVKELLDFLQHLAAKTWGEVGQEQTGGRERHHKHHSQKVSTLSREAQDRLSDHIGSSEMPESLYRFRLGGTLRLWGIREGALFKIIWWDRNHKVYPV